MQRVMCLVLLVLSVACTSGGEPPPSTQPPVVVVPDPPAGPHLRVTAVRQGADVDVTVRAYGVGDVFGVSYHLTFDPLVLLAGAGPGTQPAFLDGAGGAHHVLALRAGDIAAGGVRTSVAQGNVALTEGQQLLQTRLRAVAAGITTLRVERVVVKRANGVMVAVVGTSFPLEVAP